MWIQLLRQMQIEQAGVTRNYYPGDWIDVGRQSAQRWVIDGIAQFAMPQANPTDLSACGVALIGVKARAAFLKSKLPDLALEVVDAPTLRYAKTLVWATDFTLRPELVPVGFGLLDKWEVAAPITSYDVLACHIGSDDARERTRGIIHDLRVPLYEPRLLFVKRCRNGHALLEAWAQERETDDDDRLCLLRAIYRVKALLCALPVTWNRTAPRIA